MSYHISFKTGREGSEAATTLIWRGELKLALETPSALFCRDISKVPLQPDLLEQDGTRNEQEDILEALFKTGGDNIGPYLFILSL